MSIFCLVLAAVFFCLFCAEFSATNTYKKESELRQQHILQLLSENEKLTEERDSYANRLYNLLDLEGLEEKQPEQKGEEHENN